MFETHASPPPVADKAADSASELRRRQAVLDAEALRTAILTSANFSIIATDEKGIIQLFNVGAERMLGYTTAEVVNRIKPSDIHDPQEVRERAEALSLELGTTIAPGFEALAYKASRGIEDKYELSYIRKDGTRFPAIVSVTALRGDDKGIIGYLLIGTDNSARKQIQDALGESQKQLTAEVAALANINELNAKLWRSVDARGGLEKLLDGAIALMGADMGLVQILNPRTGVLEILAQRGFQQEFLDSCREVSPSDTCACGRALREDARVIVEDVEADESFAPHRPVAATAGFRGVVSTPLRGRYGAMLGILSVHYGSPRRPSVHELRRLDLYVRQTADFIEWNRAQQEQEDSETRLRQLVDALPAALYMTDAEGYITMFNPATVEFSGRVPELGKDRWCPSFKLYRTDGAPLPQDQCPMAIALREDRPVRGCEVIAERPDGRRIHVIPYPTPLHDSSGRLIGGVNMLVDITARKQEEKILREATATAHAANRAKSDFLSSMSHELRTPLNAILGFAQLVESGSPPPTTLQKSNLQHILKAGWYLQELINEILDLALIESGKLTLSLEPVSLSEVLLECRAMIESEAGKRGIGLTFPRFDIPCFIQADRTRLKQVLVNLLFNAVKYNSPAGALVVECSLSPPDSIRIGVRDTGAGLAPAQLAQLFQPFNRLGKESGTEEGTGIGLVMTKRLVELMGGSIRAESTVGTGSVFSFELSLAGAPHVIQDAGPAAQVPLQVPNGAALRTVLYVEDNPANLELVEQLIARRTDLRLYGATDAKRGIEFALAHQPAVVLMDINLPGISGIEALRILRASPTTAHIPIIAVSANAMLHDIENGLAAGFFDYITKPIKVNQFMNALDMALAFSQITAAGVPDPATEQVQQ